MPRPSTLSLTGAIGAGLVFLLAAPLAMAQTWDGDANTNWGLGTNWNPNSVPTAGSTVIINGAGGANQPALDVNSNSLLQTTISAGTLTVDAVLNSQNVSVQGTGNLNIRVGGEVRGNVSHSGTTINNDGIVQGNITHSGGAFNNAGLVNGDIFHTGGIFSNSDAGGRVNGNITTSGGTFNNRGIVDGRVVNTGTLRASNGASFGELSNTGLLELGGGTTGILGALTLGAGSTVSVLVADHQSGDSPLTAGTAVLGGTLMLDFTGVVFSDDSWAFDLVRADDGVTGGFSGVQVAGLAPGLSYSTGLFGDHFTVAVERTITTPVPEPETYAMLLAGLGVLGFAARRRKLKPAA